MGRLARGFLALLLALVVFPAFAQPAFPKFTGLVVDNANVLPPQVEADLTAKLEALQRDTKRQLVVATIADMGGLELEDYSIQLAKNWKIGLGDVNNGALLIIAPNDRKGNRGPRIEVGRGLEGFLTDAYSGNTIRETMLPRLRAGDIPGAMTAGTDALIVQLRSSPEEAQARTDAAIAAFNKQNQRSRGSSGDGGFGVLVIFALIFIFIILPFLRGGRGRRYRGGSTAGAIGEAILWTAINAAANSGSSDSSWSGGGGGGGGSDGSWGGGGFTGGGGGDFGGGGASGDW